MTKSRSLTIQSRNETVKQVLIELRYVPEIDGFHWEAIDEEINIGDRPGFSTLAISQIELIDFMMRGSDSLFVVVLCCSIIQSPRQQIYCDLTSYYSLSRLGGDYRRLLCG